MKVFILEDNDERMDSFKKVFEKHEIHHAVDTTTAKDVFDKSKPFDLILLDHDLGGEIFVDSSKENTGYQFTKYLTDKVDHIKQSQIILHSQNRAGAENMYYFLKDFDVKATMVPFPVLIDILKREVK